MFKIAVCDDESYFRQSLKDYISDYMKINDLTYQIDTYSSGEELISLGIGMVSYTAVFLDINMNEIDGVMAAKKIRKTSKDVFIVFVTAYVDYTLEGYKVDAIRYLLKNNRNLQDSIDECLDAMIEKLNYKVVKKEFKFNEGTKEVCLERLLYIESKLHKLEFHIMEDEMKIYTMYEILNQVERNLDGYGFIRIHQSFLVNLKYIKSIIRYKAILDNGVELIIPKARYKQVKDVFIAYQGEV